MIFRVPASGGDAAPVTTLDAAAQETSHRWPRFLPDGKRFLFMSRKRAAGPARDRGGVRRGEPADPARRVQQGGRFRPRSALLRARDDAPRQALDRRTLAVSGEPVPVAEDRARSQLTWLDRQGQRLGTVGPPAILGGVALSPDDRRVLVHITDPARDTGPLFVLDAATRVTFGAGNQLRGLYSPDGRLIVRRDAHRGVGVGVLARWTLPRLRVRRVRQLRGLHSDLPRIASEMAGLHERGRLTRLARRREGALLPHSGPQARRGPNRPHRGRARARDRPAALPEPWAAPSHLGGSHSLRRDGGRAAISSEHPGRRGGVLADRAPDGSPTLIGQTQYRITAAIGAGGMGRFRRIQIGRTPEVLGTAGECSRRRWRFNRS